MQPNWEFWTGSGSDPNKNMVWISGGAEKYPTGRFGLDLVKFGLAVEMLLCSIAYSKPAHTPEPAFKNTSHWDAVDAI
jgi:hypothetical protein